MRITVILVLLSLLAVPALAESGASPDQVSSCANATPAPAGELSDTDLASLGFEVVESPVPASSGLDACPVVTSCTEFSLCMDSDICSTKNTGDQCCLKNNREICCVLGTIHVTRCACTAECDPFCDPCPANVVRSFTCALPDF